MAVSGLLRGVEAAHGTPWLGANLVPRRIAQADEGDREAIVADIESELGVVRSLLKAFLAAPEQDELTNELAGAFRGLAARATQLEWIRVATLLSRAEAVVKGAAILGSLEGAADPELARAIDALAEVIRADRERERTPTSGPLPPVAPAPGDPRKTQVISVPTAVAGPRALADMLRARGSAESDGYCFAIRHVARLESAHQQICGLEPAVDAILVDSDEPGADGLIDDLLADPKTDAIPIVVVGTWHSPEQAARYVALGAARCLAKPLSSGELRRAMAEVSPERKRSDFIPLGTLTLNDLGRRLADELERGLCDAALDDRVRHKTIDLGEGSAVLTVFWDSLARIRELVSAQTAGELRFKARAQDEALPSGIGLERSTQRDKSSRTGARGASDFGPLGGFTVLVAEEDLSTNWFLSGVLREAGATVFDAFGGQEALQQAETRTPDAVIAAVGLTGIDGLTLARMLQDDVLLRDVPVVLLADDAAQARRVHELGVGSSGAIQRGATAEGVRQRLCEALRSRQSLLARIAEGGRVQGRLDSLTPATLLRLVGRSRPNARVSIQAGDAVYEIELRAGAPVRACRTGADGRLSHGVAALSALLPIIVGRFMVEPSDQPLIAELEGSFLGLIADGLASTRRAQALVSGRALMRVERVRFRTEAMTGLLAQTPEPARTLLGALMTGASPRRVIARGEASAELVERVLIDAARRGGIESVESAEAIDEPMAAVAPPFAALPAAAPPLEDKAEDEKDDPEWSVPWEDHFECDIDGGPVGLEEIDVEILSAEPGLAEPTTRERAQSSPEVTGARCGTPLALAERAQQAERVNVAGRASGYPGASEPVVLAERAQQAERMHTAERASGYPTLEHASEAKPEVPGRAAPPPSTHFDWRPPWADLDDEAGIDESNEPLSVSPLLPPRSTSQPVSTEPSGASHEAILRGPPRAWHTPILASQLTVSQAPHLRSTTPILTSVVGERERVQLAALDHRPVAERISDRSKTESRRAEDLAIVMAMDRSRSSLEPPTLHEQHNAADLDRASATRAQAPRALRQRAKGSDGAEKSAQAPVEIADVDVPRQVLPSSYLPRGAEPPKEKKSSTSYLGPILFATVGVALAVGARWWRYHEAPVVQPPAYAEQAPPSSPVDPRAVESRLTDLPEADLRNAPVATEPEAQQAQPTKLDEPVGSPNTSEDSPTELPLAPKERQKLGKGEGLLEVVCGRNDEVFVDGKRIGLGPVQRLPLVADGQQHEVRVRMRGEERVRYVTVTEATKVRLRIAPPWSR